MTTKAEFYPKYKYHAKESPVIVLSKHDEDALGKGWENTPAAFEAHSESAPAKCHEPIKHKEEKPKGKHK